MFQGPDGVVSPLGHLLPQSFKPRTSGWESYQRLKKEADLDIAAIDNGDFTSLAGTGCVPGQEIIKKWNCERPGD